MKLSLRLVGLLFLIAGLPEVYAHIDREEYKEVLKQSHLKYLDHVAAQANPTRSFEALEELDLCYKNITEGSNLLASIIPASSEATKAQAQADWTIFIMIEARNNLSAFAAKNLQDIARVGSSSRVNIVVQWHQYNQEGLWRYKLSGNKIELDIVAEDESASDPAQNLMSFVEWGAQKYPANHNFLILWNHGMGISEPAWGNMPIKLANQQAQNANPRAVINGITTLDNEAAAAAEAEEELEKMDDVSQQRGIMFDEENKIYMTNHDLSRALSYITGTVLKKPFDVIGMDACFMAMVEVGYQIRDYSTYFVASQEVELAQGWNYPDLLTPFMILPHTPLQTATRIVQAYEKYYRGKTHLYTQSVMSLANVSTLKGSIDNVANCLRDCMKQHGSAMRQIIRKARSSCLQYSSPAFIDLHSFYTALLTTLDEPAVIASQALPANIKKRPKGQNKVLESSALTSTSVQALRVAVQNGFDALSNTIVANTASNYLSRSRGASIYYPRYSIEERYPHTDFGKNSAWTLFLQESLAA